MGGMVCDRDRELPKMTFLRQTIHFFRSSFHCICLYSIHVVIRVETAYMYFGSIETYLWALYGWSRKCRDFCYLRVYVWGTVWVKVLQHSVPVAFVDSCHCFVVVTEIRSILCGSVAEIETVHHYHWYGECVCVCVNTMLAYLYEKVSCYLLLLCFCYGFVIEHCCFVCK